MPANRRWGDLSPRQQATVLTLASVELALTATALADLLRRPATQVRGDKRLWAIGVFIQPIGPIAYLTWGARRPPALG
jgi:hypothetical protein